MAELLARFKALPWYGKGLVVLLTPIILFLAIFALHGKVMDLIESATRAKVDAQSAQLAQQVQNLNNQAATTEGAITELEKLRDQAVQQSEEEDAVAFHNGRPTDSPKP